MTNQEVETVIQFLEQVRQRPFMYFVNKESGVVDFLLGFNAACELLGHAEDLNIGNSDVLAEHGWAYSSLGGIPDMRAKGLSDTEIIDKVLQMQIDVWKRLAEK